MTLFDEYNAENGHRKKPKAIAVIVDHVTDENNDGAADIEDVKLFLKKNKANRIALKGNDQYPGGDFRPRGARRLDTPQDQLGEGLADGEGEHGITGIGPTPVIIEGDRGLRSPGFGAHL